MNEKKNTSLDKNTVKWLAQAANTSDENVSYKYIREGRKYFFAGTGCKTHIYYPAEKIKQIGVYTEGAGKLKKIDVDNAYIDFQANFLISGLKPTIIWVGRDSENIQSFKSRIISCLPPEGEINMEELDNSLALLNWLNTSIKIYVTPLHINFIFEEGCKIVAMPLIYSTKYLMGKAAQVIVGLST